MEEKKQPLFPMLVMLEILVLCGIIGMSFSATKKAVQYDTKYAVFYGFTVLGILIIAGLIFSLAKKKPFTVYIGIGCIVFYFMVSGFGDIVCTSNMQRLRRLEHFRGSEIVATVDGREYRWDGESVIYDGTNLTYLPETEQNSVYVDGEKRGFAIFTGEDEQVIYVCIDSSLTGDYLELQAVNASNHTKD